MESFLSFFSAGCFISFYYCYGIYKATLALMITSSLIFLYPQIYKDGSWRKHIFYVGSIWLFGGMSIYFANDLFIKLKPTFVFWGISFGWFIAYYLYNVSWFKKMVKLSGDFNFHHDLIEIYDIAIIFFYFIVGLINLFFVMYLSNDYWIIFKTFGVSFLHILFFLVCFFFYRRYHK